MAGSFQSAMCRSASRIVRSQLFSNRNGRRFREFLDSNRGAAERNNYLVIDGGVSAPLGPSGISAPFNAQFVYCPVRPGVDLRRRLGVPNRYRC